jgi:hypothetical protein
MEFNSRLHKILNVRNMQIEKLTSELVELRGPVINLFILVSKIMTVRKEIYAKQIFFHNLNFWFLKLNLIMIKLIFD